MFESVANLTLKVDSDGVITASGRLDRLEQSAKRSEKAGTGFSKAYGHATDNLARFAVQLAASYIGLQAMTRGVGAAVRVNIEFERTMSSVSAVTRATDVQFAKLEGSARKLGASTMFSASQAAEGMRFLGMAGFETNEIISAMPGLLDLAIAGALDLGEAADITSNIMSGFNLEAAESGRVADVLAAAASSANTDVRQLGEGMKFVAPIAASLDIAVEDTAAAMGVLSDAGLQASMAGTGLRRVLSELSNPTAEAQRVLESYGLTLEELDPQTNNLIDIVGRLRDIGLSAGDALTVFGDRGAPAILALTSQTDRLRELNEEMATSSGRAKEMADVMGDNLAGDIRILKSALEELALIGGDSGVNGMLRKLTQTSTLLIQGINHEVSRVDLIELAQDIGEVQAKIDEFGELKFRTDKLEKLTSEFDDALSEMNERSLKGLELQFDVAIKRQREKISELREFASEGGDGLLFGTRSARLDQVDEAVEALRNLLEIQKQVVEAQPIAVVRTEQAAAEDAKQAAAEAKKLADQKAAEEAIAAARREADRRAELEKVAESLKSEEELVRDSYQRRLDIVMNNTDEGDLIREELKMKLEQQLQEELDAIQQAKNTELESLQESLLTEEEAIALSYERRREIILNSTTITEEERARLLARVEKKYSEDKKKYELSQWKQSLSAFDDFQNNLLVLARTGNKELAAVYKAAAIANTIVKTYESATSAYAAMASIPYVGPALGTAAAAAAIAAGLANVQVISSTNYGSFVGGGNIPEGGVGLVGESGPELVRGPVEITSRRDTKRMLGEGQKLESKVYVSVINNSNEEVQIRESENEDGKMVEFIIGETEKRIANSIRSGDGDVPRALQGTYSGIRRGVS